MVWENILATPSTNLLGYLREKCSCDTVVLDPMQDCKHSVKVPFDLLTNMVSVMLKSLTDSPQAGRQDNSGRVVVAYMQLSDNPQQVDHIDAALT
jgi:hypothetical protein